MDFYAGVSLGSGVFCGIIAETDRNIDHLIRLNIGVDRVYVGDIEGIAHRIKIIGTGTAVFLGNGIIDLHICHGSQGGSSQLIDRIVDLIVIGELIGDDQYCRVQ